MLVLRCLVNLFKESSAVFVLRERRQRIFESVSPHIANPKSTVKEAAITVVLNYSITFLLKDDQEGRI
jgi:hypothetical protein